MASGRCLSFSALVLWVAALGCGSGSQTGGRHPADGSSDAGTMSIEAGDGAADGARFDAAACGCTMADDVTLRTSWACYCQVYGCPTVQQATLCTPAFKWTSSCGLIVGSSTTAGGLQETVFDSTGVVVGVRRGSDVPEYGCAGDHTGTATALIAGQLPAVSCSPARCTCSADGGVTCPPPDAG